MPIYYAGLNPTSLYLGKRKIEKFTEVPFANVTNVYIDWNYFLLWRDSELWITGSVGDLEDPILPSPKELRIPDDTAGRCLAATGDTNNVTVLTSNNEIWRYVLYENTWRKIPCFLPSSNEEPLEKIVKIDQGKAVTALTNLGRVFNLPALVDTPQGVKFSDVSSGIEHALMLAENGDVYSMGLGTRGQLGLGDLEDSDEPTLIEALAGLKVSQISASGWCSAAVTKEGDLYVWGWNNEGQLGLNEDHKVIAVPTFVEFKDESGRVLELTIIKVQCTSSHLVCMTDNGELWGCGSNKYGQLGRDTKTLSGTKRFVRMMIDLDGRKIKDFKCRARGTLILTNEVDH